MKLTKQEIEENINDLALIGWQKNGVRIGEDDLETEGYNVEYYFRDGSYLGPDQDGVEPVFEVR
jgi:hypothetical protein